MLSENSVQGYVFMFFITIFLPRFKAQWSSVRQCCKLPMVAAMRSSNGCVSLRPNKSCWGCSLQSFYMRDLECMVKDTSCWWLLQIKYLCNRRCQKSAGIQRLSILQVQFLCLWPCIFKRYTCFLVMFFNLSSIAFCLEVFYSAGTNSGLMLFTVFERLICASVHIGCIPGRADLSVSHCHNAWLKCDGFVWL